MNMMLFGSSGTGTSSKVLFLLRFRGKLPIIDYSAYRSRILDNNCVLSIIVAIDLDNLNAVLRIFTSIYLASVS